MPRDLKRGMDASAIKAADAKVRGIGSSFDDFLKEQGIYEEVTARAIKRVIERQASDSGR